MGFSFRGTSPPKPPSALRHFVTWAMVCDAAKGDKKMEQQKEKRDIKLTIRLSQSEYEKIQKKCDGKMAVWIRDLALDNQQEKTKRIVQVSDPDLLRHLSRIGNNLNQIARSLNMDASAENLALLAQFEIAAKDFVFIRDHFVNDR